MELLDVLDRLVSEKLYGLIGALVVWSLLRPHLADLRNERDWLRERWKK
jgi:hypothetical protein